MFLNPRILSSAAAIAITCAVSAAAYYYKSRNAVEINEVMVFCKLQLNAYNYFDKLISYVEAAKKSVNVCMPSIHNPAIQSRLVALIKKKNITVRIIIDRSGYNDSTDFFINELIEAGAEIKCNVTEPIYKMQHKFCIVDDKVLMTGTLDWGNDLTADHWNYVYITSKPQLVEPVKREFYQMWDLFSGDLSQADKPSAQDSDTEFADARNSNSELENMEIVEMQNELEGDSESRTNREETPDIVII
ncbi:mitochondrial cardiolipin hydrolase [Spodoptera frugiperda]|uniref:Mitochondrial cardiolipin hydrolase n=1 Tax=Spodoptera frugiperda TaxID=7108 RepID=A0A9R0D955_SPOFR|nr:mitochondrial cardiolipin hydrolase [Spodoptera frugiperda]